MNNSFLRKREIDSSFFHCTKPAILDWDCKFLSQCVDNGPRIALQRHQQYSQVSLQRHFKHELCVQNSYQPISPHFVNSVQKNVGVPPIISKIAPIYVSFFNTKTEPSQKVCFGLKCIIWVQNDWNHCLHVQDISVYL